MKKFSEMNNNNTNKTTMTSTNTNDFIANLVNETLSIKDGNIEGTSNLINTIVKLVEVNESKTIIKTLENVKVKSFKHFDMNWINESINSQKDILNNPIVEATEEVTNDKLTANKTEVVAELITESKSEEGEDCKCEKCKCDEGGCTCKPEDEEEVNDDKTEEETEVSESTQEIVNKINWIEKTNVVVYLENAGYAVYDNESTDELKEALVQAVVSGDVILDDSNKSFVTESTYVVDSSKQELINLSNIYESIMNDSESENNTENNNELNFKTFKEMFGVQMNQFTNEGVIFNFYGEELDFVEKMIFENKVASIIETDGIKTLVDGFKTTNRVGYIVTDKSIQESLSINLKR